VKLRFYTRYALRALRREGQRTLLAIVCIAFGVMSVISMQLLAEVVRAALITDPRTMLGADALLTPDGRTVTAAQVARLQQQEADGTISAYQLQALSGADKLRPPGTGHAYLLLSTPMGIDPATPLVGAAPLGQPADAAIATILQTPMAAVIGAQLAGTLHLRVGDTFTLFGDMDAPPVQLQVGGIMARVAGGQTDTVLYSMETARRISGTEQPANRVAVLWSDPDRAAAALAADGWEIWRATDTAASAAEAVNLFSFMFKGAGILGLFVGGIGVAHTLRVLLARRTTEIAMLKTVGYQRRDLLLFFGIETALLGGAGALVGLPLAVGVSQWLMELLGATGAFSLVWRADPWILVGGAAVGILTAVIFGLFTIVRASAVRPAALLRDQPIRGGWREWVGAATLFLLLLFVFTGISIAIMGSPVDGAAVMGGALAGLAGLIVLFGGLLLGTLRLPTPRLALLTLARRNLRSQLLPALFALIALFMGVFAIGLAGTIVVNVQARLTARTPAAVAGPNLTSFGTEADLGAITGQLAAQDALTYYVSLRVPAEVTTGTPDQARTLGHLDGRESGQVGAHFTINSGGLTGATDALLPSYTQTDPWNLHAGDPITVTTGSNVRTRLRVSGFYTRQEGALDQPGGVIVGQELARRLGNSGSPVVVFGQVPEGALDRVTAALGTALPQAALLSTHDLAEATNRVFTSLFAFAAGIASLALVAGAVLIANGVGLALVQRRREIGILKAVGFSARRVLGTLLIENALLGALAGGLGMLAVEAVVVYIDATQPAARLSLDLALAGVMIGVAVLVALVSTTLVAWSTIHSPPAAVLRNE
jgi:putative ABC transport system permease protein